MAEDYPKIDKVRILSDMDSPPFGETEDDDNNPHTLPGPHPDEKDVNILREKTFNPELRNLVDRIKDNEPDREEIDTETDDLASITDDELLIRLYRLFYRAKNLHDNREINISFDPFAMKAPMESKGFSGAFSDHLSEEMKKCGYPNFSILTYDLEVKGFTVAINFLRDLDPESIVISMWDDLYVNILRAREGLILSSEAIAGDVFFKKKFIPPGGEPLPIFFVSSSRLTAILRRELNVPGLRHSDTIEEHPFFPSPIVMIQLGARAGTIDLEAVSRTLFNRLPMLIYCFDSNDFHSFQPYHAKNLDLTFRAMNHLLTVFLLLKDPVGIMIRSSGEYRKEVSYLMRYLVSRCSRVISSDSAVIHIAKNSLLMLTNGKSLIDINAIVEEYAELFPGHFEIRTFNGRDFSSPDEIITDIIFSL